VYRRVTDALGGVPATTHPAAYPVLATIRHRPTSLLLVSVAPSPSPLLALAGMDADRERIEDAMRAAIVTSDAHLTELARHLVVAGGKRLRPVLAVVAAQVGGGPASDDAVLGGVACELVQTGSLCHDDVMDEAETRRGVETVNARWGNLQAILAGDFLLARASEIAASLGTEVAGLLARTIGWLCEGQIEELRHTYDIDRPEASYFTSIHGKTASLFGTSARIGAIVAGFERPVVDALTDYGNAFGMVFQIVDDVLDLTATADQLGKPAGHDMEEGVYTLPVLRTLTSGGAAAAELRDLLGRPLDTAERDKALAIVRSDGGIEAALGAAGEYVDRAVAALDDLPVTPAVEALRASPAALLATVATS
jgi:heptaprenyl diphosphate synthase